MTRLKVVDGVEVWLTVAGAGSWDEIEDLSKTSANCIWMRLYIYDNGMQVDDSTLGGFSNLDCFYYPIKLVRILPAANGSRHWVNGG